MNMLLAIAIALGCAAAFDDLRRNAVSNWINLSALLAGLIYHTIRHGWAGLGLAAAGALLGFAVFLVFFWLGAMGGGDVKLMAAFGALLGPSGILLAALLAAPIGALIAAGCLAWNRHRRSIPYAPAIVLGAWMALLGRG
jgi:prepilin peptidase CpaA